MMKKQINLFWTALMFYTRIPCPKHIDYSEDNLNKATRFFPLIGWIVGIISFIIYYVMQIILPLEIAVIFSMVAGILTTGTFHEDGFADFFDGFGGGWTKDKILEIMKDSRVGTYGMVASILLFGLKFFSLVALINNLQSQSIWWILALFICYHALARGAAIQLCFILEYVRDDEKSKAKPIAKKQTIYEKIGVFIFAIIPLLVLCSTHWIYILTLIPLLFIILYFKNYLFKWIGGYTGDCLGAVEQICEVVILLSFLALWKFM